MRMNLCVMLHLVLAMFWWSIMQQHLCLCFFLLWRKAFSMTIGVLGRALWNCWVIFCLRPLQVAGTSGKAHLEGGSDDEGSSTEAHGRAIIIEVLGREKRNEVLAALYLVRTDVSITVAGVALGELVRKLGERVLPLIIPILSKGLNDPNPSRRQVLSGVLLSSNQPLLGAMFAVTGAVFAPEIQDALHASVLSILFAMFFSLCYIEFEVSVGSRVRLRELVPFIVGWNILVEYVIGGVVIGRSWTYYLTTPLFTKNRSLPTPILDVNAFAVCFYVCIKAILSGFSPRQAILSGFSPRLNKYIVYYPNQDSFVALIVATCVFIKCDPNYKPFQPPINGVFFHVPSRRTFFISIPTALALLVHLYHVSGVTTVGNRNKLIAFLMLILGASIAIVSSNSWIASSIAGSAWFFSTLGLWYLVPLARNPRYLRVPLARNPRSSRVSLEGPWIPSLTIVSSILLLRSMDTNYLERCALWSWSGLLLMIYYYFFNASA
nr:cationic amino acid transporter 1-like [Ipomoea batatas]